MRLRAALGRWGLRSALRLLPAGGGAAREGGDAWLPGLAPAQEARRWNFEPEKVWCFSRAVFLQEEEKSCAGASGEGPGRGSPYSPRCAEFRLTLAEGGRVLECPLFL